MFFYYKKILIVTMISSIFGIAITALLSGILTAGFIQELSEEYDNVVYKKIIILIEKEN